jgi:hypothetical protein
MRMRFAVLALLAAAALAPTAAHAHGATPQKVVETIDIAAPPSKVWAIVGDFQNMDWLPGVVRTEGVGGNEPETAHRRLILASGATLDDRLVQYDASAMSLRYLIEKIDFAVMPINNFSATLTVRASAAGAAVEWKARFYRAFPGGNPPENYTDEKAIEAVEKMFREGLAALKAKVESPP